MEQSSCSCKVNLKRRRLKSDCSLERKQIGGGRSLEALWGPYCSGDFQVSGL